MGTNENLCCPVCEKPMTRTNGKVSSRWQFRCWGSEAHPHSVNVYVTDPSVTAQPPEKVSTGAASKVKDLLKLAQGLGRKEKAE